MFVSAVNVFAPLGILIAVQASQFLDAENKSSEANQCRLKVAQFSAELERFPVAIAIYESLAEAQMGSNILKYSASGNLLNAGLCRLNGRAPFCCFHSAAATVRQSILHTLYIMHCCHKKTKHTAHSV